MLFGAVMKRTALALTLTSLLLTLMLIGLFSVDLASADFMPVNVPDHNVEITADGNVTGTDKIQQDNNIYTFTGNIVGSIVILRDNITIDGAGYALQGNGYRYGIFIQDISSENGSDVLIKNLTIMNYETGVLYSYYHGVDKVVILSGNTFKNNTRGIMCYNTNNIIISDNKIVNNDFGIRSFIVQNIVVRGNFFSDNRIAVQFEGIGINYYTSVCGNNFVNNTYHAIIDPEKLSNEGATISWDNGSSGNFWSNYNGSDLNLDGIGDTPYVIDKNNQDNYPHMAPFETQSSPEPEPEPEPFPTTLVVAASGAFIAIVGIGLLVYFKKRKHAKMTNQNRT